MELVASLLINLQPVLYLSQGIEECLVEAPEDIRSELEQKQVTKEQVLQVQELTLLYPDAAQPSLRDISFDSYGQNLVSLGELSV